jgi:hypothetical protein
LQPLAVVDAGRPRALAALAAAVMNSDHVIWFRASEHDEAFHLIDETILANPRSRLETLIRYNKFPKEGSIAMLAEKFFLMLESLIRTLGRTRPDGSVRVVSTSPHVPVRLPTRSVK